MNSWLTVYETDEEEQHAKFMGLYLRGFLMSTVEDTIWCVLSVNSHNNRFLYGNKDMCMFGRSVVFSSLWSHGVWATRLLHSWNFPGKNTGVGCHFLVQGIFPTQGSKVCLLHLLCLLHWQVGSLPLALPRKPHYS